ncbi:MAG: ribonuclease III [Lachnospiraceae bacterium]|nr:ribonuclease III [Lachnospiraceae bacterium]
MDKSVNNDLFSIVSNLMNINDIELVNYSPLTFAYIGDAIYEVAVRTVVVCDANMSVNKLHKNSTKFVKAESQAKIILTLIENDELTEEEIAVYKRGRNAKSYSKAKNASYAEYRTATGFEALIGYLYLSKQTERMMEIINKGIEIIDNNN